jgi:hypothetical protein
MRTSWPNEALQHELSLRNPVAEDSLTGSERSSEATALLSRLTAMDPGVSVISESEGDQPTSNSLILVRPERASKGRLPRLVAVGLVASVLVVVLVVVNITSPGKSDSAGAVALKRTAFIANEQPPFPPLGPGQLVYTKNIELAEIAPPVVGAGGVPVSAQETYMLLQTYIVQTWTAADGSGRMSQAEKPGPPSFLNEADRAKWIAAGSPDLGAAGNINTTFGPGGLSVAPIASLSALPTNPSVLGPLLANGKVDVEGLLPNASAVFSPQSVGYEIGIIGSLLGQPYASPALRSALYQVASALPGVQLLGTVTDGIGRRGTAVAYTLGGWQDMLIFDPTTSALLEQKTVAVGPDAGNVALGTVGDLAIYGTPAVVDSSTATPSSSSTGVASGF